MSGSVVSFCDGVAAVDSRGEVAGFLTSLESEPDPRSPMARHLPERSSLHLVHGHAVAGHVHPGRIYSALFGELARRALDRGIVDHIVHVPIGDPATEAAWVALGFGRVNVVAVRDVAPLERPPASDVQVRVATSDELDIVARHDGHDIGIVSLGPGRGSPLYVPHGAAYIAATAVTPDARRSGAGASLVEAAFAWARDHAHLAVCLHFSTANATSTSFWTGVGFTPVMVHLRRRLDERILTSRPP
jgi:GNAT superfamily N-acetyltransferase